MISEKDIQYKTVIFISAQEPKRFSIRNGELLLSDAEGNTLTKFPFPKIEAIFVAGNCTLSSPILEKFARHAVPFCLMTQSLRPILWKADMAEANYLLRKKQYRHQKEEISIAKYLMQNKTENQIRLVQRLADTEDTTVRLQQLLNKMQETANYEKLMSLEARAASLFFRTYFASLRWSSRKPRVKQDPVNSALDIGYTILFNFIEANLRLFGFDLYVGVYHQDWFRRKSLVCDIMEPFRCIIDRETLLSFREKRFRKTDFEFINGQYLPQKEKIQNYYRIYVSAIVDFRMPIFRYIRDYYRCFMKSNMANNYPIFLI